MKQRSNAGGGGGSSPPSLTATPQCLVIHHLPPEEIQTPELLRSEAEQLVGQELIKALANFKQMDSQNFGLNRKTKK
jgi:hypothetical protein